MSEKLVFSTSPSKNPQDKSTSKKTAYQKGQGPLKMRLEKNGRGGKVVTVLFNLPFEENEAKQLMKELQAHLACGATFKNSTIELRGDVCQRAIEFLKKKNINSVRAGG